MSIIFFIIYFISGFIFGFTQSPYNHTLINIFKNIIQVVLPIYGIEIIRYKLLKSNQYNFLFKFLITIIIIMSEINFKALFISHNITLFHYLVFIIIPIITQNILFSYLSLNSHFIIPIIIRLFNDIPIFLLPIIPFSNWYITGSFSVIKTTIIYFLFKYFIFNKKTIHHLNRSSIIIDAITIIISTLLILFMLGLFKYQAIAILSNSMNPTFNRGDVVIYQKTNNIFPGDIIVYKNKNQIIVHRVISINESYYITKGDANNTVDYLKVSKEDIKGVYKFHIKYLGYPAIWLNEFFNKRN